MCGHTTIGCIIMHIHRIGVRKEQNWTGVCSLASDVSHLLNVRHSLDKVVFVITIICLLNSLLKGPISFS